MGKDNIEMKFRYKTSSVIMIIIIMSLSCFAYLINGLYGGTFVFLLMLIFSTFTHNCYEVYFNNEVIIIKKIYGKNIRNNIKTICNIQLDSPFEELRILGLTRYLIIEHSNGEKEKYNIESIASKKFEKALIQYCDLYDIPICIVDDLPTTNMFYDNED